MSWSNKILVAFLSLLLLPSVSCRSGDYEVEKVPPEEPPPARKNQDVYEQDGDAYTKGKGDRIEQETCNGKDSDGDGAVDEGCACSYKDLPGDVCTSIRSRRGICMKPDEYQKKETKCDGKDNDCDGEVDEGCKDWNCFIKEECEVTEIRRGGGYLHVEAKCPENVSKAVSTPVDNARQSSEDSDCWFMGCPGHGLYEREDKVCEP